VAELDLPDQDIPWGATDAECGSKIWDLLQRRGGTALAELELLLRDQQAVRPELRYLLYVSRGERERNDPWCEVLLHDLQARLLLPDCELRYLDEGTQEDPTVWWPWSLLAMRRAQALICLYTRSFFRDPYCGRVWRAFSDKLGELPQAERIFPLQWGPETDNPEIPPRITQEVAVHRGLLSADYWAI
jgi:hypothetical protein